MNVLFLGGGAPAHQLWTTAALPGPALDTFEDDTLGYSLLAGDFDSDGIDDLAIANTGPTDAGRVHILYDFGLGPASRQTLVDPFPSTNSAFGYGMAAGDLFPGVGLDLVIGEPGEDLGAPNVVDAGVLQYFSNVLVFPDGFESGDTSAWSATIP